MTEHQPFDWGQSPVRVDRVALKVRDLGRVVDFYASVIGLSVITRSNTDALLGAGDTPLVSLIADRALAPNDGASAGLFHTAFLLPSRADLARWLVHAEDHSVRLDGAADHKVSEAVYLSDPEGNGIEVYADRSPAVWRGTDGVIAMVSDPLDLEALAGIAGAPWNGFPDKGFIGHVHLRVGDANAAEGFYADVLGLDVTARRTGAAFYGAGGYHHQLAANHWRSQGAGQRDDGTAGLESVDLLVDAADLPRVRDAARNAGIALRSSDGRTTLEDPWGTQIGLLPLPTH